VRFLYDTDVSRADVDHAAFSGAPVPAGFSADEQVAYERLSFVYAKGIGYGVQMGLRPQTLYGIADSPVGLAAYFLDHDARSYELIARAWTVLMKRLGYTKFVAQGGDWGAIVTELMGVQAPPELLGIHTNMPNVIPLDIDGLAFSGRPAPANLSAEEKLAYERLSFVYAKGIGYGFQMGLRPQTLYGIADSPVGLAAYFLDHDARSYEMIARVFAGGTEGLTRDDVLDNITLTWLTNTALSGARLYWENKGASFFAVKGVVVPTAVSVFPDELYPAPRSWAERAYPKLIHYNKVEKGGHFAAWEQPQLFAEEVRAGFRSLRVTQDFA
jgi:pimeloyl-ACP methyl ester carboxylesterase